MTGNKATALHAWAVGTCRPFLRFDYSGHGASAVDQPGGRFADFTVSDWLQDTLDAVDALTDEPQILVGSSMGAWLAMLACLARPGRVAGLVLLAPACDFTERLLWARMSETARRDVTERGVWLRPSHYGPDPYPITHALIEDGRRHLLMGGPIPIHCPVRILHGLQDPDVPWRHGLALVNLLQSRDVTFALLPSGDHRLSDAASLERIEALVEGLVQPPAIVPPRV